MKTFSISKIAKAFDLSRSTLLYYDRIGLLRPAGRTPAGYRYYMEKDYSRLERICYFRNMGLTLKSILIILSTDNDRPETEILEKRLEEINAQILELKSKQALLSKMLKYRADATHQTRIDKSTWIEMLRAAGMNEKAMGIWHMEFETRSPTDHHKFLFSLGIPEEEVFQIRKWATVSKSNKIIETVGNRG